ncbi:MAG: hypothetical protein JNK67_07410 [Alphaproteobacteria bacterium]|nr:hypothetical protein [Alphaproteobacteria bacterium]
MTSTPEPRPRYVRLRIDEATDRPPVLDPGGAERGRLVGVVLDLSAGDAAFAIVGGSGLLEAHRPVPWPVLVRTPDAGLCVPIDDDAWRRAPTQPPEAVIDWNDEDVHRRIRGFYDPWISEDQVGDATAGTDCTHGSAVRG